MYLLGVIWFTAYNTSNWLHLSVKTVCSLAHFFPNPIDWTLRKELNKTLASQKKRSGFIKLYNERGIFDLLDVNFRHFLINVSFGFFFSLTF